VVVKFNENVQSVAAGQVKILKGNINVTGTIGSLSADGKSVEVGIDPLVYGTNETSANLSVEVSGVVMYLEML
jgi:hypothetical protein